MDKTVKVQALFQGDRGFPVAAAKLPEHVVADFNTLLTRAQELYPLYTHETLFRYIWTKGLDNLRHTLKTGGLPHPDRAGLPPARRR